MIDLSTFLLFLMAVLTLLMSPGPNMALIMSYGVAQGPQAGVAAAGGVALANLFLTALTATGLTALIAAWPPSFDVLRYIGAAYLSWLAYKALVSSRTLASVRVSRKSLRAIVSHGMFNCLLNPKVLLFHLIFIPQFVLPTNGHVSLQLLLLGITMSISGFFFNGAVGATSGHLGAYLSRNPRAAKFQGVMLGVVLLTMAIRLITLERPAPH